MKKHLQTLAASIGIALQLGAMAQSFPGSGNDLRFDQDPGNSKWQAVNLGTQVANSCRSIEFWFRPGQQIDNTLPAPVGLVVRNYNNGMGSSNEEFAVYFTPTAWDPANSGRLTFTRRNGTTLHIVYSDSRTWSAGTWYHVASVIDPSAGMLMYVNGVQQASTDASTNSINTVTSSVPAYDAVAVGAWGYPGLSTGLRPFSGEIDELRFWTIARSQQEVRDNMCRKISPAQTGLRACYSFDTNASNTLPDLTSNHYDGLLATGGASVTYDLSKNWQYSSAPIGDESVSVYTGAWSGQSLSLSHAAGDVFSISNVSGTPSGAHIYRVSTLPNTLTGLNNPLTSYYGVFLAGGTSARYSIQYNYAAYASYCTSASTGLMSRADNAAPAWTALAPVISSCTLSKDNESSVNTGAPNRAEYILVDNKTSGIAASHISGEVRIYSSSGSGVDIELGTGAAAGRVSIDVYNYSGALVKQLTASGSIIHADMPELSKGLYIFKVTAGTSTSLQKVVLK